MLDDNDQSKNILIISAKKQERRHVIVIECHPKTVSAETDYRQEISTVLFSYAFLTKIILHIILWYTLLAIGQTFPVFAITI
jgi:hypothetical protein